VKKWGEKGYEEEEEYREWERIPFYKIVSNLY